MKIVTILLSLLSMNFVYAQRDTLTLKNKFSQGTIAMITRSNSMNHTFQFYEIIATKKPYTGFVKIIGKKGNIYVSCLNGIPMKDQFIFKNEIETTNYYQDSSVTKTQVNGIHLKTTITFYTKSAMPIFLVLKKKKQLVSIQVYCFENNKRKLILRSKYFADVNAESLLDIYSHKVINILAILGEVKSVDDLK